MAAFCCTCVCVCVCSSFIARVYGNKKRGAAAWRCHKLGLQIRRRDVPNYKADFLPRTCVGGTLFFLCKWFSGAGRSPTHLHFTSNWHSEESSAALPRISRSLLVCAKAATKMSLRANKFLSEEHKAKAQNADEGAAKSEILACWAQLWLKYQGILSYKSIYARLRNTIIH